MDDLVAHFSGFSPAYPTRTLGSPFEEESAIEVSAEAPRNPPINASNDHISQPLTHPAADRGNTPVITPSSSFSIKASVDPTSQGEGNDHGYIHHFSKERLSKEGATPRLNQKRNLLSDLTALTQEDLGPPISSLKGGVIFDEIHRNRRTSSSENSLDREQHNSQKCHEESVSQQQDPKLEAYKGEFLHEPEDLQHAMQSKNTNAEGGTPPSAASLSTTTDLSYKPLDLDGVVRQLRQQNVERNTMIEVSTPSYHRFLRLLIPTRNYVTKFDSSGVSSLIKAAFLKILPQHQVRMIQIPLKIR